MKYVGAVLIIGACLSAAAVWNSSSRGRLSELDRLLAALKRLDTELTARGEALPQLLERIRDSSEGTAFVFFHKLCERMDGLGKRPFQAIWEETVSEQYAELGREEFGELSSLGQVLGRFPIAVQHQEITNCMQKLEQARDEQRRAYERDRKLILPLSASTGVFLLLMLV